VNIIQNLKFITFLFFFTFSAVYAGASSWESHRYLMEGVYYLINEGNQNVAEEFFKKAIISSSFDDLSEKSEIQNYERQVVAEAFYFLGKIYYEKSKMSDEKLSSSGPENMALAKKYFKKATEYGIVYDQLHPALLDEIKVEEPIFTNTSKKSGAVIEVKNGFYGIDAVAVDKRSDIKELEFSTNKELELEGGTRYKINIDAQKGPRIMYRMLIVLGAVLAFWIIRS
jgi:hypothetical protein